MLRPLILFSLLLSTPTALAETEVCPEILDDIDLPTELGCVEIYDACGSAEVFNGCDTAITVRSEGLSHRDEVVTLGPDGIAYVYASADTDETFVVRDRHGLHEGSFTLTAEEDDGAPSHPPHGCSTSPGLSWMGLLALLAIRRRVQA